jgi:putative Mg2+ transporter-C (MgtC) family protein
METLYHELTLGLHDRQQVARIAIRLLAALVLGGLVGIQRQRTHKPAGLRTHMLVCLATAVFVTSCGAVGMAFDAQSRVIQGIVTGLGFIGAGSILKLSQEHEIKGLTTAAGVWMTGGDRRDHRARRLGDCHPCHRTYADHPCGRDKNRQDLANEARRATVIAV